MPLVHTATLVAGALDRQTGIAAFNIITLEHAEAAARGAEQAGGPVIVQISENAVRYHGGNVYPIAAGAAAVAHSCAVPVALHLDHVEDMDLLHHAAEAGFSSVMFDASRLPYEENVELTRQASTWGHGAGLYLEAELGAVGGKGGAHTPGVRTDPDEAVGFVAATGVDALAVAVGSAHAMRERTAVLDLELIRCLADAVPVPLVLHGSSGVTDDHLREAVEAGIVKVNIGTMLNVAFTAAVRQELGLHPDLVDPRTYLNSARTAIAGEVARMVTVLGTPAHSDA